MGQQNPRWFYPEQIGIETNRWLHAIDRGDNLAILFFPKADRPRRLDQFLNDTSIRTYKLKKKVVFLVSTLEMVEDREEIIDAISRQLNTLSLGGKSRSFREWMKYLEEENTRLVFLLPEAEKLLDPYGKVVFEVLSSLSSEFEKNLSVVSVFETNITNPAYLKFLPSNTRLLESIFYYPLYEEKDAIRLLAYLQNRWGGKLSSKEQNEVLKMCGGHPWLLAEITRLKAANGRYSFDEDTMIFRMRTIFSQLQQHDMLIKLLKKESRLIPEEQLSFRYLQKMRFFDTSGDCTIGYVEYYLRNHHNVYQPISAVSGKIILSGVSVDSLFSPKERRVIKLLLEKQGTIVSRDEIAKRLWPVNTEEQYSDWAIDQVMTRLRKRFSQLSLPTSMLKVVRGRGYLLNPPGL